MEYWQCAFLIAFHVQIQVGRGAGSKTIGLIYVQSTSPLICWWWRWAKMLNIHFAHTGFQKMIRVGWRASPVQSFKHEALKRISGGLDCQALFRISNESVAKKQRSFKSTLSTTVHRPPLLDAPCQRWPVRCECLLQFALSNWGICIDFTRAYISAKSSSQ